MLPGIQGQIGTDAAAFLAEQGISRGGDDDDDVPDVDSFGG